MNTVVICFIIFILTILGYIFYDKLKLPMGVTAMSALLLLTITGCIDEDTALAGFSNPNTVMILGMFIVAAGFNRTQAVNQVTSLLYKIGGGSYKKMYAGFLIVTCILSQFVPSPMVVFTVMYPMVLAMCDQMNVSPSKAIFPVGFVAVSTCGVFPVGSGAVAYATQNGYLESFGAVERFQVLDFFKARVPVLLVIMLYAIFLAPRFAPEKPPVPLTELSSKKGKKEQAPLSPVREKLALLIFTIVTLGLIFQSKLPLESWQITLIGAVLMVGSGVLSSKEALNAIPLRIICMYIGALSLAAGLTATGAGDVIGNWLSSIVGDVKNGYVIGALFFLAPFLPWA